MYKKIGILGGMSPESTVLYYQHMVRRYEATFGDVGYPEIIIYSVSFQAFRNWMDQGDWNAIADGLIDGVRRLHLAGSDFAVMATNTMHIVFDKVQTSSPIPLLSIIDAVAESIVKEGVETVGLLGTIFTMEKAFYIDALAKYGIKTLVPERPEREYIQKIIRTQLTRGLTRPDTLARFQNIIEELTEKGAGGIILGCTEIPLLVSTENTNAKLFDSTRIHADKALDFAIRDSVKDR